MGRARFLLALTLLACCVAAQPEEEIPPLTPTRVPGGPCLSESGSCLDSEVWLECIDREWVAVSCPDTCIDTAPAYVDGVCSLDQCQCELDDPEGCEPGTSWCGEQGEVLSCNGQQEETSVSCEDVCGAEAEATCALVTDGVAACVCAGVDP